MADAPDVVQHYYDEDYPADHELAPLCKRGRRGDQMTFFIEQTTCPLCLDFFRSTPIGTDA